VWALAEWITRGKPSVLGFCSGIVAGLVVITPGAGFVLPTSAVIIGIFAGIIPYVAVAYLKRIFGYDDALDTFGVHGVGGTLGAILTGIFADERANSVVGGLKDGLLVAQLKAVGLTIVWSVVATAIIAYLIKAVIGLRPTEEVERQGLDINEHGEEGYVN
jgi:Amt family ammonium transporter